MTQTLVSRYQKYYFYAQSDFCKNAKNVVFSCYCTAGLFDRDVTVIEMVLKRGIPCATVIGGGYDDDIEVLGRRHSIIHRAAIKASEQNQAS